MTNCAKAAGMPLCFLVLMLWASRTRAEITVIRKNTFSDPLLSPLSLKIAGSIRPEFVWDRSATHDLRRHGHDGGSRFRFTAGYQLTPALSVVGRYLWGVDLAHVLGLKHHYNPHQHWDIQRQMFGGIALRHVGQLTYGHQHGVYYDVIGSKSDIWDFDGNASANWIGVPGDYGGGDRPRNAFKYKNTLGRYTLYADYLLPQHAAPLADDRHYQRRHGEGIGVDYQAWRDLTLSAAWDQTNATVTDARGERRHYRQHFSGAALRWRPGRWTLVGTATWYRHYVPVSGRKSVARYFARHGYGLETFFGYTFLPGKTWLHAVQPYLAADTLRLRGNEHYHARHAYLGAYVHVAYGLSFYLEHTFTATSDGLPDITWLTFFYNF